MPINIYRRSFLLQLTALGAVALFEQCKIKGKPLVYFIGDSLTAGIGSSDTALSYPHQTVQLIKNIDFDIFGYPGLTANEYYNQQIHNLIISSKRYILAVIFFGANDLTEFPTNKVYTDIVNVHRFLNSRGVKTIAVPVLNREDKFSKPDFDRKRLELNKLIKANYKSFSAGFVDPATAPEIYNSNAPDNYRYFNKLDRAGLTGLHLTDAGASVLARAVAKELKSVIAS